MQTERLDKAETDQQRAPALKLQQKRLDSLRNHSHVLLGKGHRRENLGRSHIVWEL